MQRHRQALALLAWQVELLDLVAARHGRGAFDAILQLAHVARPVAVQQDLQRLGRDAQPALVACVELFQEVLDQQRNVFAPLAQRRQGDRDHVDAVIEVLAECTARHRLLQVAVGGENQAHVHLDRFVAADALELAFLQHTQQLGLECRRDLADLVQEQRAAVRQLEAALAFLGGAGERALLVTEQLRLQQGLGERRAVHADERRVLAWALGMDGARDDFLAGTALAAQQHRGAPGRRLVNLGKHLLHARTAADDVLQAVGARRVDLQCLLQAVLLLHQPLALGGHAAVQAHRLADQVGDHLQYLHVALELGRTVAGLAFAIGAEHAEHFASGLDGHAEKRDHRAFGQVTRAGAVEKQRFLGDVRHDDRHPGRQDPADDALPGLVVAAPHLVHRQAVCTGSVQLAGFLHQTDHAAAHFEVGGQHAEHFPQGLGQIEGRIEDLADLVYRKQFRATFLFYRFAHGRLDMTLARTSCRSNYYLSNCRTSADCVSPPVAGSSARTRYASDRRCARARCVRAGMV